MWRGCAALEQTRAPGRFVEWLTGPLPAQERRLPASRPGPDGERLAGSWCDTFRIENRRENRALPAPEATALAFRPRVRSRAALCTAFCSEGLTGSWKGAPWPSKWSFAGHRVSRCRGLESEYVAATSGPGARSWNHAYQTACFVRGLDRATPHQACVGHREFREGPQCAA